MSMREEEYIEDLIGKFVVGEASEEEILELEKWSALTPENQKYLDDSLLIFERAQLSDQPDFDAEKAWENVKSRITGNDRKASFFLPVWGIAAGLALIFSLSFLLYSQFFKPEEFQFVSENEVVTQALPDQTEISLNQNSHVEVVYNERKKTGRIHLTGEVLVSIPDSKKVDWIVQTGNLLIEDIGTVFHVKAYPDSETVEVTVQEGMVRFFTETQLGITLHPGEKGTYNKAKDEFLKAEADINVTAFKTRNFSFFEEELSKVVADLMAVYETEIILDGNIASCKITVDFANEDLETILAIIAETMSLEIVTEGDQIRISGDGCF
ncbi:MAG: FecR domain-containing protein [Algoriphagus sp.]|nr:FecR domain-containing protein [Algoriphagus sp.]